MFFINAGIICVDNESISNKIKMLILVVRTPRNLNETEDSDRNCKLMV